jgi:molybdenum cofactor biosynthesis enzyme MoaA
MTNRKVYTLSPVVGGLACNARCPFCVAGMTPANGVNAKGEAPQLAEFKRACEYARLHDSNSLLYTSKGEPTLWPDQLTQYLEVSQHFDFESVELQTNGIPIFDRKPVTDEHLRTWRKLGLKLVALSIVHYDAEENRKIYLPYRKSYIDLPALIADLHKFGFEVRLSTVMIRDAIDTPAQLQKLIDFAKEHKVKQLTVRPVAKPDVSRSDKISAWVGKRYVTDEQRAELEAFLDKNGTLLSTLPWGGRIYDVGGQNVCSTNCLTRDEGMAVGRQLIFFPDGKICDDWTKPAVSLEQYIKDYGDSQAQGTDQS